MHLKGLGALCQIVFCRINGGKPKADIPVPIQKLHNETFITARYAPDR